MIDKTLFKKTVCSPFRANSFLKKGDSWYLSSEEVVAVVNFQKSDWGESYYINIGFGLKALNLPEYPKVNYCHIYTRAGSLFPELRNRIDIGCALTEELGYSMENLTWLVEFINKELIPFCSSHLTENSLKKFCKEPFSSRAMIMKEGREMLCGG